MKLAIRARQVYVYSTFQQQSNAVSQVKYQMQRDKVQKKHSVKRRLKAILQRTKNKKSKYTETGIKIQE